MRKNIFILFLCLFIGILNSQESDNFFIDLLQSNREIFSSFSKEEIKIKYNNNFYRVDHWRYIKEVKNIKSTKNLIKLKNESDIENLIELIVNMNIFKTNYNNLNDIDLPIFDSRIQAVNSLRVLLLKKIFNNYNDEQLTKDNLLINDYFYKKMLERNFCATQEMEKVWLISGYQIGTLYEKMINISNEKYSFFAKKLFEQFDLFYNEVFSSLPTIENEKKRALTIGFFLARNNFEMEKKIFDKEMNPQVSTSFIKNIFSDIDPVLKKYDYFRIRNDYRRKNNLIKSRLVERKYQVEIIFESELVPEIRAKCYKIENGIYFPKVDSLKWQNDDFYFLGTDLEISLEKYDALYRMQVNTDNLLFGESNLLYGENFTLIGEGFQKTAEQQYKFKLVPKTFISVSDEKYALELKQLMKLLKKRKIPEEWFLKNVNNPKFKIHKSMNNYFANLPEHKVIRKEKDKDWYLKRFGVEEKIIKARDFIHRHKKDLIKAQNKNGIHYELIVALIGIETNFADNSQKGNFYVFNALVSQYLLTSRKSFSLKELVALYEFEKKINKDTFYFIGSFAGASGWGQFIPSSQLAYFIDKDNIDYNTDIYSVEDNIFSIENYLSKHNLSGRNIHKRPKRYDAVYAYNHSSAYVKAVLYIYNGLRKDK